MKHIPTVILISALALSTGVMAKETKNDAVKDAATATVSLTQAVQTAENGTHGKAVRAHLTHSHNQLIYLIETVNGEKLFDVKVDPTTGALLSSHEDKRDFQKGKNEVEGDESKTE
jgi:uncharacterized membrane protein YkoI